MVSQETTLISYRYIKLGYPASLLFASEVKTWNQVKKSHADWRMRVAARHA
jgi:hypothetical protein